MNKHMKKRVCIITALILVMTALMGCGSGTQSGGSGQSSGTQSGESGQSSGTGFSAVEAVYPEAIAKDMDAQEFVESEEHWNWWDGYREKLDISAKLQPDMMEYNRALMQKVLDSEDENTVCSPLNIYVALAMLAEISDGNTRAQILDVLQADSIETLRAHISALWESNYVDTPILKSILADSLWIRDNMDYNTDTLKQLAMGYYASTFSGTPGSAEMDQALQEWTDENTGGLLSDYTKDLKLDPETVMAIVSTIYYKAAWYNEFYEDNNTQETFHGTKGDTTVEMMHQSDTMGVYQTDSFTAVSLGLQDSGAMTFYLPQEGVDVREVVQDEEIFNALSYDDETGWSTKLVNLSIPKFSVSHQTNLMDTIAALGITDAMDPAKADFTPLAEKTEGFSLSSATHAAMVEIDENGVTGAAFTMLVVAESAMEMNEEMDFVLDRPFLFMVTGADGSVLFSGIIQNVE